MFKVENPFRGIIDEVPRGELVAREGAMIRNNGDHLTVMTLHPPCRHGLGHVRYIDGIPHGKYIAEPMGLKPCVYDTPWEALRHVVQSFIVPPPQP